MMAIRRVIVNLAIAFAILIPTASLAVESVKLRVALYPYVPGKHSVFNLLAQEFQRRNEGLVVEMVEVPADQDYYDGGLAALDADVYEIDSILLSDVLHKLAPLSLSLDGFSPESVEAVTRNGVVYAVPHWMCGNFLFYRKSDTAIRDADTWEAVTTALARQNKPLLVDFFGQLTLGEWYMTMLADRKGAMAAEAAILSGDAPDSDVVADLNSILSACPTGMCRSRDLHDRTGYYARAFIRGEAGAYVGYSESVHYALQEAIDNCRIGGPCLSANEVAVRRLPKLSGTSFAGGVGWVDGLAISNVLSPAVRQAALNFVQFATSADAYKLVLEPDWMEAPRYLLPARTGLVFGDNAPFYPDFLSAHAGRKTGTLPGLNRKLQVIGTTLNCMIPIDRTDTRSARSCNTP